MHQSLLGICFAYFLDIFLYSLYSYLSINFLGDYILTTSTDQCWAFSDIRSGRLVSKVNDQVSFISTILCCVLSNCILHIYLTSCCSCLRFSISYPNDSRLDGGLVCRSVSQRFLKGRFTSMLHRRICYILIPMCT